IGITAHIRSELCHSRRVGIGNRGQLHFRQAFDRPENFAYMALHAGNADADFLGQAKRRDRRSCEQRATCDGLRHAVILPQLRVAKKKKWWLKTTTIPREGPGSALNDSYLRLAVEVHREGAEIERTLDHAYSCKMDADFNIGVLGKRPAGICPGAQSAQR